MPKKKTVTNKTKPKSIPKPRTPKKIEPLKKEAKVISKQVDKDIKKQNNNLEVQAKQAYLFSTQETDVGTVQLDSLNQRKSKEAKNLDFKEAWYCPSKELHDAFRFYTFQNNMKKSNIITKAIVEMLEREGFLKKT